MYKTDCSVSVSYLDTTEVSSLSVKYRIFITAVIIIFSASVYSQDLIEEGKICRFTGLGGNDVFSTLSTIRIADFDSLNLCGYALKLLSSLNMKITNMSDNDWFYIMGVRREKDLRCSIHLSWYDNIFFITVQESANDNTKFSVTQEGKCRQRVIQLTKAIIYQIKNFFK